MKHIILFSGGLASSYVAYLVSKEQSKKDIILLHTPTYSEHADADRFRHQVAKYLKLPITTWGDGRDIWQLIDDNNCLPSQFMPFCTQQLKQIQSEQFYKTLDEDFIIYVGFGADEWKRVQRQTARFESIGRKSRYPLFEQKISSEFIRNEIENVWKIEIPEPYKHLKHNNCIPCFKAGKSDWKLYYQYYPEQFWKASEYEEKIGYTVFKGITLKELAEIWKHNKDFEDSQCNLFDSIPCMCSL